MSKSKLIFCGIATAIMIGLGGFHLGRGVGQDSARTSFERETYLLQNFNAIAWYLSYSQLSADIAEHNVGLAKCSANVIASARLRQIKACLAEPGCRDAIHDEVVKTAPEILAGKQKFTYYENGEECFAAKPDK